MSHVCKKHERFVPDGQSCPYCEPESKAIADKLIEEFKKEVKAQATPAQVPGTRTVPTQTPGTAGVALPNWISPAGYQQWWTPGNNTAAGAVNPMAVWLPPNPNGTAANPLVYDSPRRIDFCACGKTSLALLSFEEPWQYDGAWHTRQGCAFLDPRRKTPPGEPPKHEFGEADVCTRCGRTGLAIAALGSVPCVMRAKAEHAPWNQRREAYRAEERKLIEAVRRAESDLREFYARKRRV